MLARIKAFVWPRVIFPFPAGMTADRSSMFGLQGLINNVNNYSEAFTAPINAGAGFTIAPAQIGQGIILITAASGGFNATLPTTAQILSFIGAGNSVPTDGSYAEPLSIQNDGSGQTCTLVAGDASTTLTGTMTVANNTRRTFLMTVTSSTTITIRNTGSLAL